MKKTTLGLLAVFALTLAPSVAQAETGVSVDGRSAENNANISFESTGSVLRITDITDLDFGTEIDPTAESATLKNEPQIGIESTIKNGLGWNLQVKFKEKTTGLITPNLTSQLSYIETGTGTEPSGNATAAQFQISESSTDYQTVMEADHGTGTDLTRYAFASGSALTFGSSSNGTNQSMTLTWNLHSGPAI